MSNNSIPDATSVGEPANKRTTPQLWPGERFANLYEKVILSFVQLFLMFVLAIAVFEIVYLVWHGIMPKLRAISEVGGLQRLLQNVFGGALLVMIGLELLETTRAYLLHHHIRLEVIVVVAMIALGRHIILLDVEHLDGVTLIGVAALVFALMVGYWVVRSSNSPPREIRADPP